jgi:hypothetical protein
VPPNATRTLTDRMRVPRRPGRETD